MERQKEPTKEVYQQLYDNLKALLVGKDCDTIKNFKPVIIGNINRIMAEYWSLEKIHSEGQNIYNGIMATLLDDEVFDEETLERVFPVNMRDEEGNSDYIYVKVPFKRISRLNPETGRFEGGIGETVSRGGVTKNGEEIGEIEGKADLGFQVNITNSKAEPFGKEEYKVEARDLWDAFVEAIGKPDLKIDQ